MKYLIITGILFGCGMGLKPTIQIDEETNLDSEQEDDNNSTLEPDSNQPSDELENETAAFTIDSVSPWYDTVLGGKQIEIHGGPFPVDAQVSIGVNTTILTENNGNKLTVIVPSSLSSGQADIHVDSSVGNQTLSDGFYYFDNNAGMTGAIGYIRQLSVTGDYWQDTTYNAALASVTFLQAMAFSWWEFFVPQMDFCSDENFTYQGQVFALDLSESQITLSRNGQGIDLPYNASTYAYESAELSSSAFMSGTFYDLDPLNEAFIGFESTNFAVTSTMPVVTSPDISGYAPPTIYANPTFQWVPSNADWIHITIGLVNSDNTGYESTINCIAVDDGTFVANTNLLSAWPSGRQLDIYFARVMEAEGFLPHDHSSSRVIGENVIIGAGFVY